MHNKTDRELALERWNKSPSVPLRLLGQLDETETAFDDFWERHHTKLEQCLQLRHFEQHFREVSCRLMFGTCRKVNAYADDAILFLRLQVRAQLDATSERLSGFSEVSISPAHAEHVLRELGSHEDKACVRPPPTQPHTRYLELTFKASINLNFPNGVTHLHKVVVPLHPEVSDKHPTLFRGKKMLGGGQEACFIVSH